MLVLFVVVNENDDCHRYYYNISEETPDVRDLVEHQETKRCGEDYLRVVKHRDLLCRCIAVRSRYRKLSARSTETCADQTKHLPPRHRVEVKYQPRQRQQTRKRREVRYDHRSLFAVRAEVSHAGVSKTCAHSAKKSHYRCKQISVCKCRLDNEQCTDKCSDYRQQIEHRQLFFEEKIREHHAEKR